MGGDEKEVALVHAPLTVRPTPFPRASFEKAKRAATVFNTLIDRVSRDAEYLQRTLALAAEYDEFTVGHSYSKPSPISDVRSAIVSQQAN